jgi:hypothetical protein
MAPVCIAIGGNREATPRASLSRLNVLRLKVSRLGG